MKNASEAGSHADAGKHRTMLLSAHFFITRFYFGLILGLFFFFWFPFNFQSKKNPEVIGEVSRGGRGFWLLC